jgi:hypothetical protein
VHAAGGADQNKAKKLRATDLIDRGKFARKRLRTRDRKRANFGGKNCFNGKECAASAKNYRVNPTCS